MKIFYSVLFLLVILFSGIVKASPYTDLGEAPVNPNAGHYWGPYYKHPVLESQSEIEGWLIADTSGQTYSNCLNSVQNLTCTWEITDQQPNIFDSELTNFTIELNGEIPSCPEGQQAFIGDSNVCTPIPEYEDDIFTCPEGYTAHTNQCFPDITEQECASVTGGTYTYSFDQSSGAVACVDIPDEEVPEDPDQACSTALFEAGTCQLPSDGGCGEGYTYGQINGQDICVWDGGTSPPEPPPPPPVPEDNDSETTTETTVTENPDGSVTTTTTTTHTSSNGQSTTQTSTSTLHPDGSEESEFSCEGSGCSVAPWGPIDLQGGFGDGSDQQARIDTARSELLASINQVKDLFTIDSLGGGGSLPCLDFVNYDSVSEQFCLDDYQSAMDKIAAAIAVIAAFAALAIIFR
jgi:hypothetical protein